MSSRNFYGVKTSNRASKRSDLAVMRADRRTCPACNRRAALTYNNLPDDVAYACRWCHYSVQKPEYR